MNEYTINEYGRDNVQIVKADLVFVDGSIATFSNKVKTNVGQDNEYDDFVTVASIDISKMYFLLNVEENKEKNKKLLKDDKN